MVKVGITGVERGPARLLEQGAVAFTWLGRGPLMAARRTEELLRAALGVPDRIPYAEKRAVRAALPSAGERAAELAEWHRAAAALGGWPESLERLPCAVTDHGGIFGLEGLRAASAVVSELTDGGVVAGTLVAVAGPDLHLWEAGSAGSAGSGGSGGSGGEAGGRVIVVDGRLLGGWRLEAVGDRTARTTVPLRDVSAVQGGLF